MLTTPHVADLVCLLAASVLIYHHIAYPKLLAYFAGRRRRWQPEISPAELQRNTPKIEIIVPVHNEQAVIQSKIENLAAVDYPQPRLKIVLALDGCTDRTRSIVDATLKRLAPSFEIEVVEYAKNIGKIAVLNDRIGKSNAEVVVLTDASSLIEPDAVRAAVGHFSKIDVGVVCPTYRILTAGSTGEDVYWQHQIQIKADEAALAAPMGAHGAFYLFRRELWTPLPPDTINDDFILPMKIVADGYRAVYDRKIAALELEQSRPDQDFRRRVRIGAGNLQQFARLATLANPRRGWLAFVFLSGKGLRPFLPLFAFTLFIGLSIGAAEGRIPFVVAFTSISLIVATAAIGHYVVPNRMPKPLALVHYILAGYTATMIGGLKYILGSTSGPWRASALPAMRKSDRFLPLSVIVSKRAFDICFALAGIMVLALFFVPIALAIKMGSSGPVLYWQRRAGTNSRLFWLPKFRSMRSDAEAKTGPTWASTNDPRVTRVGRFLRATRLDELPQFWSVLTGDMSVVGPRPERPEFVKFLEEQIPFYDDRVFELKPGITGLAQVNQGYDASIEDVRKKLQFDQMYAVRLITWMDWLKTDLGILLQTVSVVFHKKGQ